MSDTLTKLRARLGVDAEITTARSVAVEVCAAALDLVRDGKEEQYPDAITAAFKVVPQNLAFQMQMDPILRTTVVSLVSGMMDCLTTEWHT